MGVSLIVVMLPIVYLDGTFSPLPFGVFSGAFFVVYIFVCLRLHWRQERARDGTKSEPRKVD